MTRFRTNADHVSSATATEARRERTSGRKLRRSTEPEADRGEKSPDRDQILFRGSHYPFFVSHYNIISPSRQCLRLKILDYWFTYYCARVKKRALRWSNEQICR